VVVERAEHPRHDVPLLIGAVAAVADAVGTGCAQNFPAQAGEHVPVATVGMIAVRVGDERRAPREQFTQFDSHDSPQKKSAPVAASAKPQTKIFKAYRPWMKYHSARELSMSNRISCRFWILIPYGMMTP